MSNVELRLAVRITPLSFVAKIANSDMMKTVPRLVGNMTQQGTSATTQLGDRPGWLQDANSMLLSAFCHLVAFLVLALVSVASSDGWSGVKLLVNLGEGGPEAPLADVSSLDDTVHLDAEVAPAAALGPPNELEIAAPVASERAESSLFAENSAAPSGASGVALGGGKVGDRPTGKAAAEFFGIGGYGQTFVYVVDASDSMNDHDKFERARYELLHSIEQLNGDQRYFVIFYNEGAYPMDADKPLLASEDNVAATRQWIEDVSPTGGTNPLPALLYALSLRPDAIYFLSDGQFDPAIVREVQVHNRQNLRLHIRQIPIHTIAFYDRIAEGLMRSIARNSGGEYRYAK